MARPGSGHAEGSSPRLRRREDEEKKAGGAKGAGVTEELRSPVAKEEEEAELFRLRRCRTSAAEEEEEEEEEEEAAAAAPREVMSVCWRYLGRVDDDDGGAPAVCFAVVLVFRRFREELEKRRGMAGIWEGGRSGVPTTFKF